MSEEFENESPSLEDELTSLEQENESPSTEIEEPVVQKAKSTGHLSKEDYLSKHGSLKGYKTEDEFVRTGDMIEQIYSLKKKLHERDGEVEAILNYTKSTIEEHKSKVRQELENKLTQAREYGNIEAVEALTRQKTQMDYTEQQDHLKHQLGAQQQAVSKFLDRNNHWYNPEHPDMVARCNEIDQQLSEYHRAIGKPLSYDELAVQVELQMKREFPDVVNTETRARPTMSASKSSVNKSLASAEDSEDRMYSKLSQDHKLMYQATKRMLSKSNISYSLKDFASRLKSDGEI